MAARTSASWYGVTSFGSNIKDQLIFSHTPLHTVATSVSNQVTLRVTQRYVQMKEHFNMMPYVAEQAVRQNLQAGGYQTRT